jgi:hypothetical protein
MAGTRRWWVCAVLLVFMARARPAAAGSGEEDVAEDVVFLVNGGRVRGTVMEEDGETVSIRRADGVVRRIPRAEVSSVRYGDEGRPADAAGDDSTAGAGAARHRQGGGNGEMVAAVEPHGARHAPPAGPGYVEFERRSRGAMIAGIVLLSVGAAGGIGGLVAYVSGDSDDTFAIALPIWIVGGTSLITGIVLTAVGAPKVPIGPMSLQVGPAGAVLGGRF